MTVTIQIGNSDDKLSQSEWSHYVCYMRVVVEEYATKVHFSGLSDGDAPWQNACWVIEPIEDDISDLVIDIRRVRKMFRQESMAITVGTTRMV